MPEVSKGEFNTFPKKDWQKPKQMRKKRSFKIQKPPRKEEIIYKTKRWKQKMSLNNLRYIYIYNVYIYICKYNVLLIDLISDYHIHARSHVGL